MKLYLCHQYGGLESNKKWLEQTIIDLFKKYNKEIKENNIVFMSPIHCFGYLYEALDYDDGMDLCISLLENCDYMLTFGARSFSKGCMIEKEFCRINDIMVFDIEEFYESFIVDK